MVETSREFHSERAAESAREQESPAEKMLGEQAKRAERRDIIIKDVQHAQQHMKNIALHTQQVVSAVSAIRSALALQGGATIPSLAADEERVEKLKKKIAGYIPELLGMKEEIIQMEVERLKKNSPKDDVQDVVHQAEQNVNVLFRDIGITDL